MLALNNVEHTLCHTLNRGRIPAGRNALQHSGLDIQQASLLQNADQHSNLARRLGIADEQMLDMLKGLDGESTGEDHFACRSIDHSLFLGDFQLVSSSEQITASYAIR